MIEPKRKRTYQVARGWSIRHAAHNYFVYVTTHWDDDIQTTSCIACPHPPGEEADRWAKTNAKHFGVKVEDENG